MIIIYANILQNLTLNLFEKPTRNIHDLSTILDILEYLLAALVSKLVLSRGNENKNFFVSFAFQE